MDLLMPVMDGIAATDAIRRQLPETEVIALTSVLESKLVVGALIARTVQIVENTIKTHVQS